MAEFAQFEDDVPIITSQPIASRAEGLEAISKALGGISQDAFDAAKNIGEEQSNAMMMQTQSHADTIKTNAYINMIKNPNMADKIAAEAKDEYSTTLAQAVVNKADRNKLSYLAEHDINEINLKAAQTGFENNRRESQIGLLTMWPQALDDLRNSVGDEKAFGIRLQSAQDMIAQAVRSHAITPIQGQAMAKSLTYVLQSQRAYHELVGKPDVSAREHANVATTPLDNGKIEPHGLPGDQNTLHLATLRSNDMSVAGIESDLAKGKAPNPIAFASLGTPQKLNQVSIYGQGTSSVDADIRASVPLTQLEADYKQLTVTPKLNNYERGRKDRLATIIKNPVGLFDKVMSQDAHYQAYEASYNQNVTALAKTPNLNDEQRADYAKYYDNEFMQQRVSLAKAKGLLDDHISPFPYQQVQMAQSAFDLDKDPNALKIGIGYWQHNLREYYAQQMKTPLQQEVARTVGNLSELPKGINDSDVNALILANQKGRNFTSLREGQQGQSPAAIKYAVGAALSKVTQFVSKQRDGASRVNSMVDMTANLASLLALQHGDIKVSNYVQHAADIVNAAYPVSQGANWVKSDKDFPFLDKPQMDVLTHYLINYVRTKIGEPILGKAQMSANMDMNPLQVIGKPNGELAVIDSQGNHLYSAPFSSNLLAAAYKTQHETNVANEAAMKKALLSEPTKRQATFVKGGGAGI